MQIADVVDIVILNCDNDGYIQKLIEGIRKYTEGPYKLIVIDQNSKDGSKEWLKKDSGVSHLIFNKKNIGTSEGRNQGVRVGKSEWIAFIDSDIEIEDKDWLDKIWNYTIDHKIGFIEAKVVLNNWNSNIEVFTGMSFCLVRRRCFNEVGYFDKRFLIGGELDWFARLEYSGWVTAYCPDTRILHHNHITMESSLGDKQEKYQDERDRLLWYKYTKEFLRQTLFVNADRRLRKQKELITNEEK